MTALAQNATVTLAVSDDGRVAVATNGGLGSYTTTPTGGVVTSRIFGPEPLRQTLGPFPEGASITLNNTNCSSFDYEPRGGYNPTNVAITGGTITGITQLWEPPHQGFSRTRQGFQSAPGYPALPLVWRLSSQRLQALT